MRISDWSPDVCSSISNGAAARQAFLGHHHARAPDLVFRHIDVAAFLAEAVGHVYLLEAGRDLAAVLQAQLAVEQRHLWRGEAARQVDEERDDAGRHGSHDAEPRRSPNFTPL